MSRDFNNTLYFLLKCPHGASLLLFLLSSFSSCTLHCSLTLEAFLNLKGSMLDSDLFQMSSSFIFHCCSPRRLLGMMSTDGFHGRIADWEPAISLRMKAAVWAGNVDFQ